VPTGGIYKYLGIEQVFDPNHMTIRERVTKVFMKRLHQI